MASPGWRAERPGVRSPACCGSARAQRGDLVAASELRRGAHPGLRRARAVEGPGQPRLPRRHRAARVAPPPVMAGAGDVRARRGAGRPRGGRRRRPAPPPRPAGAFSCGSSAATPRRRVARACRQARDRLGDGRRRRPGGLAGMIQLAGVEGQTRPGIAGHVRLPRLPRELAGGPSPALADRSPAS